MKKWRNFASAMRRHAAKIIAAVVVLALLAAAPEPALAQSPYAGVYLGSFSGPSDFGRFGIMVRSNGTAIVAAYDLFDEVGFVNESVTVQPNGSFSQSNIDGRGTSVSGSISGGTVSGQFVDASNNIGTFSGTKQPASGFFRDAGGYYKGSLSGTLTLDGQFICSSSGQIFWIGAANGKGYSFVFAVCLGERGENGDPLDVASNGVIDDNLGLTQIMGNVDFANRTASGTFREDIAGFVHSGTWSMTRQEPLPNLAPVALADSYETFARRTLVVGAVAGVLANDSDADGDSLSAVLASGPAHGTLSLAANGGFTYTPDEGFDGSDGFTYRASDGIGLSAPATVTLTVKPVNAMPWLMLLLGG